MIKKKKRERMIERRGLSSSTVLLNHQLMVLASVQLLILWQTSEIYGNDILDLDNRGKRKTPQVKT